MALVEEGELFDSHIVFVFPGTKVDQTTTRQLQRIIALESGLAVKYLNDRV